MSRTNSEHYRLCHIAAEWLQRERQCKYVVVELNTYGNEKPDVWGTTGWDTYVIEVKTSRSDFLADLKKKCRKNEFAMGNYRYYLLPEGAVQENEVPEKWGIILHDGEKITGVLRYPECFGPKINGDVAVLCSIMRREGIKRQIFNYRKIIKDGEKR